MSMRDVSELGCVIGSVSLTYVCGGNIACTIVLLGKCVFKRVFVVRARSSDARLTRD